MTSRRKLLKTTVAASLVSVLGSARLRGDTLTNDSQEGSDMQQGKKIVDHFMWAARDLDSACDEFENLTGVRPVFGGVHKGFGTHNSLVSLANGSYMEVLALDPEQQVDHPIAQEIAELSVPEILAFHIQRADLESAVAVLEKWNIPVNGPFDLSRRRPDGKLLEWRVLLPESPQYKHAVPVFIDWMEAPHPSATAPTGCELVHFEVGHPRRDELVKLYAALEVDIPVVQSSYAYAKAVLQTPKGEVVLTGNL